MGRPRKVSQGTMDAEQNNSRQNRGERSEKPQNQGNQKAHHHHGGRGWAREDMGALSRSSAWRAGSFWEELDRKVKVFLEKDGNRAEVHVEKRIQGGRVGFWFDERSAQPPQQPQGCEAGDESETVEEVVGVDEVTPDEMHTERMMWLTEKATTLENEKEELKRTVRDMEAKIELQENAIKHVVDRLLIVENAITQIAEHIQQQNVFNESARSSVTGVVEEIKKHQEQFQEVVRVLQNHEQRILTNGVASQEMSQYINGLALDNENKKQWIGILMKETQAQAEVLRQHHLGQQVLAAVIKRMADPWQQPQPQPQHQQITAENGPTVTVVDDDDGTRLDFMGGPSPHPTPPDIGSMRMEIEPQQTPYQTQTARM